ncbi:hypothetical protein M8C21_009192 [Ambrosia artemisiifolia]|uniref:RRM domain-containing protein n=1 Tax=Ambrosia artemisiifolia TaxID=4212 RepID=A0AAD5GQV5_AMBAR|nr:hypothetical protein M8C21_009192 [Ambrosia artemisiifolia]
MAAGLEISCESAASVEAAVVTKESESQNINVANPNDNNNGSVVESKQGSESESNSAMEMQGIVDILSNLKLNPLAEEFFPSSYSPIARNGDKLNYFAPAFYLKPPVPMDTIEGHPPNRRVVDCRVCGDPNSRLRFAFVEFADENSARAALNLCGIMLGFSQVKVLPSKTAILPVNPTFLPRVSQAEVKNFFEERCGEVSRIRLLGDHVHSTRIAFVEFVMAESAILALDCCGQTLGTQPIRVSPSKTPVRPRVARSLATN